MTVLPIPRLTPEASNAGKVHARRRHVLDRCIMSVSKILVVEDEPKIQGALVDFLEFTGRYPIHIPGLPCNRPPAGVAEISSSRYSGNE